MVCIIKDIGTNKWGLKGPFDSHMGTTQAVQLHKWLKYNTSACVVPYLMFNEQYKIIIRQ